ncbi:MAG: hypothetical protein O3B24_06755 [Verrucomicrobia bacterium]|nr:hypothetical protein [Verrucomicrobiota bacterium]
MHKAFTKEGDNAPDFSTPGPGFALPPSVTNYLTPEGARQLRDEWNRLRDVERPALAARIRVDEDATGGDPIADKRGQLS